MSPALAVVPPEPSPDRLAGLLLEAETLRSEYSGLADQIDRIRTFENQEAVAMAEIEAISRREIEAVRAWAADPQGNPPEPLSEERAKAAVNLARAQAKAGAGRVAIGDLEQRQRDIRAKQLALEPAITGEVFVRIEAEFSEKSAELLRCIAATRQAAAPVYGLRAVLAEQGRALADAGQIDCARPFFACAERLVIPDLAETAPTNGEVAEAARYWRERAAQLRNGGAA
jgi:hypothetical protein